MNPTDKFKKIFYGASDNLLIQFVRYFFVGGFAFIVDFGLLYILTEYAGLHYLLSATLSFIAGLSSTTSSVAFGYSTIRNLETVLLSSFSLPQ